MDERVFIVLVVIIAISELLLEGSKGEDSSIYMQRAC